MRIGGHVGVTVIRNTLPLSLRRKVLFFERSILFIILIFLIYYGWQVSIRYLPRRAVTVPALSFGYVYFLFPISFFAMASFLLEELILIIVSPEKVSQLFRKIEDPDLIVKGEEEYLKGEEI